MQFVFIVIISILCIFTAKETFALQFPSGDALNFNGDTKVVFPPLTFGGPFSVELWAKADFATTPGPLLFFGNADEEDGTATDQVELGISANGVLYLEVGVTDAEAFAAKLPSQPDLDNIKSQYTTNPDVLPLVRRVTCQIPAAFSNEWFLINVRATANGGISFYLNREFANQTLGSDIPVLPAYLARTSNTIGASLQNHFFGAIQIVSFWNRAISLRDITNGLTTKLNDGGLLGRWDFSDIRAGVVVNQAADEQAAVSASTQVIREKVALLQEAISQAEQNLRTAEQNLNDALQNNPGNVAEFEAQVVVAGQALSDAQQALTHASNIGYSGAGSVSYSPVVPSNDMGIQQITANTLNNFATYASQNPVDPKFYLKLAIDATNKLPFRAMYENTLPGIETSLPVPEVDMTGFTTYTDRLDGTIVISGANRKRGVPNQPNISPQNPVNLDMRCSWCNDPHYTLATANNSFVYKFDYHSPNCHIILKAGDDVQILEQSYRCGSSAGCIGAVGAFIQRRYVVIFYPGGTVTVNYKAVCLPYTITTGVYLVKKGGTATLIVEGLYELSFSGSASLKFTSDQYFNADNRSICIQERTIPMRNFNTIFDLDPKECFLDQSTWVPPTDQCPSCQNGGTVEFNVQQGCHCKCPSGWQGKSCEQFYCESCMSGTCTGPNQCTCDTTNPQLIFGCPDCSCPCSRSMCRNNGTVTVDDKGFCGCNCTDDWKGDLCQNIKCPRGPNAIECSGQGDCLLNGTCVCIENVSFGANCAGNCSAQVCPSVPSAGTCNGRGSCQCGKCVCNPGFYGDDCTLFHCRNVTGTVDPAECGDYGTCVGTGPAPVCVCNEGWSGLKCQNFTCKNCSVHGTCRPNNPPVCECHTGFKGASCSDFTCEGYKGNCSYPKGICTYKEGDALPNCECQPKWNGTTCSVPLCPNGCNGPAQGVCVDSPAGTLAQPTCQCIAPYILNPSVGDCSSLPDCQINGSQWSSPEWEARANEICSNTSFIAADRKNMCLDDAREIDNYQVLFNLADATYTDCLAQNIDKPNPVIFCGSRCPNFCNFNGLCTNPNNITLGKCVCNAGFFGADCSIQPNKRTYILKYNRGIEEAEINEVVAPSAITSHTNSSQDNTNAIPDAIVVYLYRDYRPKYGLCTPRNSLYLVMTIDDKASTTVTLTYNFNITFNSPDSFPLLVLNRCVRTLSGKTASFTCVWGPTNFGTIAIGPLPQNASWSFDISLPFSTAPWLKNVYFGSEELTGLTDLQPIPLNKASQLTISSELRNSVCGPITDCLVCRATSGCGWCSDLSYCMDGTPSGPTVGQCGQWRYGTNQSESRVVGSFNWEDSLHPREIRAYLVPGSPLTVYVYKVFEAVQRNVGFNFFLEGHTASRSLLVNFNSTAPQLVSSLQNIYPNSEYGFSLFGDGPSTGGYGIAGFGTSEPNIRDTMDFILEVARQSDAGDLANGQLRALIAMAKDANNFFSFDNRAKVCIMITQTPYHVSPPDTDYPSVPTVAQALIAAGVVPVFVVLNSAYVASYNNLVEGFGFGVVVTASPDGSDINAAVTRGIAQIFQSATLIAANTTVRDIYPATPYTSMQPGSRVRWAVTLSRNPLKRALYDQEYKLFSPGYGSVNVYLTDSDAPQALSQTITGRQNQSIIILLRGSSVYGTLLTYTITSLPARGSLFQHPSVGGAPIRLGDRCIDPLNRVQFVPVPGESCYNNPSDFCSRKRDCVTQCPYAQFTYLVRDGCSPQTASGTMSIIVLPQFQNNRPVASQATKPSTNGADLTLYLSGTDKDGNILTGYLTAIPASNRGTLLDPSGNPITSARLPYATASRNALKYRPPTDRTQWGPDFASFTYYVNDGRPDSQLGSSVPLTVWIDVINTNRAPAVRSMRMASSMSAVGEPLKLPVQLQVTDLDAVDWARGDVSVFLKSFPNSSVGYFTQWDQTTRITAEDPFITITTTGSGSQFCGFYFIVNQWVSGSFSYDFQAYDGLTFSTAASLTVTVQATNGLPILTSPVSYIVDDDEPAVVDLAGWDNENSSLSYIITSFTAGTITDSVTGVVYNSTQTNIVLAGTKFTFNPPRAVLYHPVTCYIAVLDRDLADFQLVGGATNQIVFQALHVNVAPEVTANKTTYTQFAPAGVPTTLTLAQISVVDFDAGNAALDVTITLNGPGAIDIATTCANLTKTAHTITFSCAQAEITSTLVSGLTYSITTQGATLSYAANVTVSVNDRGNWGDIRPAGTGSLSILVQTTLGVAGGSRAVTAGAIGAGAAAAVGVAVTYHFLKVKKVLSDEADPFVGMDNVESTDVVLENPLYMQPKTQLN